MNPHSCGGSVLYVGWNIQRLAWAFKRCLFKLSRQDTAVGDREGEAQGRPDGIVEARGALVWDARAARECG